MDHAAACLGTLGVIAPGITKPGSLTTPDPVTLHAEIAELEAAGVTHLALEASSQGLDQCRLDGLHVTAAGFTNLTRDHLDYHGSMDKYADAKMRLFTDILADDGIAVINADSDHAGKVRAVCAKRNIRVIDFGETAQDIRLEKRKPLQGGAVYYIERFRREIRNGIAARGRVSGVKRAVRPSLVLAADPDNRLLHMQGVYALERLHSVRGRLEFAAQHPNGAAIYVDYAHTPDGLETMLHALRPHTPGNLHVVFGCGGDRDRGKRPLMGAIAARLADKGHRHRR